MTALSIAPDLQPDGVILPFDGQFLKLQVCAPNIIRVASAPDRSFFMRVSYPVLPQDGESLQWHFSTNATHATLATALVKVRVDLSSGSVEFRDSLDQPILHEKANGRTMTPIHIQGQQTFSVRQQWESHADESLYGMGEQHLGILDIKGYDLDLWQHNGTQAVPFLVSSRGYGIFWDNTSFTKFGDIRPFEHIPAPQLLDATGKPGGLTCTSFASPDFTNPLQQQTDAALDITPNTGPSFGQPIPGAGDAPAVSPTPVAEAAAMRWEGEILATATGDHLLRSFSNGEVKIWLDGKLVVDHWRQGWLPWLDMAKLPLVANRRYKIRIDWRREQGNTLRITWKTPAPTNATSLWSEVGDGIDYYFVYGPEIDQVIAGYRQLTGQAPMMPQWAYGLWQCRQRYETADQVTDTVAEFRRRGIPFDNIVQDWMYWKADAWGSHQFDPARFPDPEGWLKTIHEKYHARLMISVWPKFYLNTQNGQELRKKGYLYTVNIDKNVRDWIGGTFTFYDAFNPDARKLYWQQIDQQLFRKGIDAWWLDGTEPDVLPSPMIYRDQRDHMMPTAAGISARVGIAYPLLNCQAVYEGQRASAPISASSSSPAPPLPASSATPARRGPAISPPPGPR